MISEPLFKSFLSVARNLNFTKAAEELYTTQPTISRQISLLEKSWGIQLFQRNNKAVRLTPEGAIMMEACRKIEQLLENSVAQARNFTTDYQGELRIGYLSSMDERRTLIPALESFGATFPNVKTTVELESFAQLRSGLDSGKYDIIFTLDFESKRLDNVEVEILERLKCHFLISDKHPLAAREHLTIQDLKGASFVLPSPDESPGREGELQALLASMGVSRQSTIYAANMESLLFYLNAGLAVALFNVGHRNFWDEHYRHVDIPDGLYKELFFSAVWRRDNLNPAIPMFVRGR